MLTPSPYAAWLDTRAGQVIEKVTNQEALTTEEILILILKSQSDQLRQLAEEMNKRFEALEQRMEARFDQVDKRFEQIDKRFEQLSNNFKWGIIVAIGFLSLMMTLLRFFPSS
jgi:uncharacterized coiled-coil DUF342 family protein